jgi:hypothetical protein
MTRTNLPRTAVFVAASQWAEFMSTKIPTPSNVEVIMNSYLVTWSINVDADSPMQAAVEASAMMPNGAVPSIATIFEVSASGQTQQVDIAELPLKLAEKISVAHDEVCRCRACIAVIRHTRGVIQTAIEKEQS